MLNFTVGPVSSSAEIRQVASQQVPYFRTPEFSEVMLENERLMKKFAGAPEEGRAVFITGSGTAAMEAAVINCFSSKDRVLVVDGGGFGHRFVRLLEIHNIPHEVIKPEPMGNVTEELLAGYDGKDFTGFLVNLDETSVGVLYDIKLISDFCKRNNIFLVVDSISSFLCDPFDMKELGVQVMLTGSQKALACDPGVSVIVMNEEGVSRVMSNDPGCMYLDLRDALKNQERGQTPFTPAVGILLEINKRLKMIDAAGGAKAEWDRVASLASYFRKSLEKSGLPFRITSEHLPNAVTPLSPTNGMSAHDIFTVLKDEYGIWVCPNGGDLKDTLFRVGHIGNLSTEDYDTLINALVEIGSGNSGNTP